MRVRGVAISLTETSLLAVRAEVVAAKPDFVINLGDMLDHRLCWRDALLVVLDLMDDTASGRGGGR